MSGERGFGVYRSSSHSVQQKRVVLPFVGTIRHGHHISFHRVKVFALIIVYVRNLIFCTSPFVIVFT